MRVAILLMSTLVSGWGWCPSVFCAEPVPGASGLPVIPDRSDLYRAATERRQRALVGTQAGDPAAALDMIELGMWDEMASLKPLEPPLTAWRDDATEVIPGVQRRQVWSDLLANWACRQMRGRDTLHGTLLPAVERLLALPRTTHPIILREMAWLLQSYSFPELFRKIDQPEEQAERDGTGHAVKTAKISQYDTMWDMHRAARDALAREVDHQDPVARAHRLQLLVEYKDTGEWWCLMDKAVTAAELDPVLRFTLLLDIARYYTTRSWRRRDVEKRRGTAGGFMVPENITDPAQGAWEQVLLHALSMRVPTMIAKGADEALAWKGWEKDRALLWAEQCQAAVQGEDGKARGIVALATSRLCGQGLSPSSATVGPERIWRERQRTEAFHARAFLESGSLDHLRASLEYEDAQLALEVDHDLDGLRTLGQELASGMQKDPACLDIIRDFIDRFVPWWIAKGSSLEPICMPLVELVDSKALVRQDGQMAMDRRRLRQAIGINRAMDLHGSGMDDRRNAPRWFEACISEAEGMGAWDLEVEAHIALAENRERERRPHEVATAWLGLALRGRARFGDDKERPEVREWERRAGISETAVLAPIRNEDATQCRFPRRVIQLCEEIAASTDEAVVVQLSRQLAMLLGWRPASPSRKGDAPDRQRARLGGRECRLVLQQLGRNGIAPAVICVLALGPRPLGGIAQEAMSACVAGNNTCVPMLMDHLLEHEPGAADACWSLALAKTRGGEQRQLLKQAYARLPAEQAIPLLRNLLALPADHIRYNACLVIPMLAELDRNLPAVDLLRVFRTSDSTEDRHQALLGLALLRDPSLEEVVAELIRSSGIPPILRSTALSCVAHLRLTSRAPEVRDLLRSIHEKGDAEHLCRPALIAALAIGMPIPQDHLRGWLGEEWGDDEAIGGGRSRSITAAVVGTLTAGWPEARSTLEKAFRQATWSQRLDAISDLATSAHPNAADVLLDMARIDTDLDQTADAGRVQRSKECYLRMFALLPLRLAQRQAVERHFGGGIPAPTPPLRPYR